jgi:hypothetical protein
MVWVPEYDIRKFARNVFDDLFLLRFPGHPYQYM